MYKSVLLKALAAVAALSLFSTSVAAFEQGSWVVRAGVHSVQPKSDNGEIAALAADVEVDSAEQLTFGVTYMATDRWGIQLLAALPFEHDIDIGGANLASTKHLPPTLTANYHFIKNSKVNAYFGVGLNATLFFEEDTRGAIAGAELELDTSYGAAAVFGIDFTINDKWFVGGDLRYFDIDTDAKVTAPGLSLSETVEIDPWAVGLRVGYRL